MFSMFLISFLGGEGSNVSGFGLRSKEFEGGGDVEWGGEAGGDEGGFDLGVKDLKADGPLGECMEEEMEVLREEDGKDGDWRE